MSTQEFKPGDRVRVVNADDTNGALKFGEHHILAHVCTETYAPYCQKRHFDLEGMPNIWWDQVRFEHAEPEDTDDAWSEPEPLKEGDWVQVWAQVNRAALDKDGDMRVDVPYHGASGDYVYVRPDAIVRPSAGQVPPWVKPAPVKPEEPDVLGAVVYSDSNGKFWTRASIDPEESHVWAGAYDKCWFSWRQLPDDVVVWEPANAEGGAS